jgi:probable rRNA maturation factor
MTLPESLVLFRRAPAGLPRRELRDFAQVLQRDAAGSRNFTCLITDDRELRKLNKQFLQKDYATDVLSFPSGSAEGDLGDIAISVDRAAEQASGFGHSLLEEIQILMLHGVLHLLGLDHESDSGEMSRAEKRWRRRLKLPTGLIERVRV